MNELVIIFISFYTVLFTLAALLLVGLIEASDPTQHGPDEVADWERSLIDLAHEM